MTETKVLTAERLAEIERISLKPHYGKAARHHVEDLLAALEAAQAGQAKAEKERDEARSRLAEVDSALAPTRAPRHVDAPAPTLAEKVADLIRRVETAERSSIRDAARVAELEGARDRWREEAESASVDAYNDGLEAAAQRVEDADDGVGLAAAIREYKRDAAPPEQAPGMETCARDVWRCSGCGEMLDNPPGTAWRWNGKAWEHRCPERDPQAGYEPAKNFGPRVAPEQAPQTDDDVAGNCDACGGPVRHRPGVPGEYDHDWAACDAAKARAAIPVPPERPASGARPCRECHRSDLCQFLLGPSYRASGPCDWDPSRFQPARPADVGAAPADPVQRVLEDVRAERARQDAKWGTERIATLPDGTGGPFAKAHADAAKARCDKARELGYVSYRYVLEEEVAEAFAEADQALLRAELVQVAAVAVKWIQGIDMRAAPAASTATAPDLARQGDAAIEEARKLGKAGRQLCARDLGGRPCGRPRNLHGPIQPDGYAELCLCPGFVAPGAGESEGNHG